MEVTNNEASAEQAAGTQTESNQNQSKAEQVAELERLGKFKFEGREWTPDQLKKSMMLHQDYTKKTQEVAQVREYAKYYSNLEGDLAAVKEDPSLASQFKQIYPKEFHNYLKVIGLEEKGGARSQDAKKAFKDADPELLERLEKAEKYIHEQEVSKAEAQIDQIFSRMAPKYPYAEEELVLARAQVVLDHKQPGETLTEADWEKLWKNCDEFLRAKTVAKKNEEFQKQKLANSKAKEGGPGGGSPGHAPRKETMKQASERAIRELSQKS